MSGRAMLVTNTLQYVWPIEDPPGEPLTRAEILIHAYEALEDVADEHDCTIMGPPLWMVQAGAITKGWQTWPGRVLIALVPVDYHPASTEQGEPLLTRAQWEEVHAVEQERAEVEQAAEKEAERAADAARLAALQERVKELHPLGLNDAEMARVIGGDVNKRSVQHFRTRLRLPANARRGPVRPLDGGTERTQSTDARISRLRAGGLTIAEIARALNLTTGAVTVAIERLNPPAACTSITAGPAPARRELELVGAGR
jgi:hypothetical protein